jgi:hypothetical protein
MPDEAKKLQATRILLTAAAVVIVVTGLKLGQSFLSQFYLRVLLRLFLSQSLLGFVSAVCPCLLRSS